MHHKSRKSRSRKRKKMMNARFGLVSAMSGLTNIELAQEIALMAGWSYSVCDVTTATEFAIRSAQVYNPDGYGSPRFMEMPASAGLPRTWVDYWATGYYIPEYYHDLCVVAKVEARYTGYSYLTVTNADKFKNRLTENLVYLAGKQDGYFASARLRCAALLLTSIELHNDGATTYRHRTTNPTEFIRTHLKDKK